MKFPQNRPPGSTLLASWSHGDDVEIDVPDVLVDALGAHPLTNDAAVFLPNVGTAQADGTNYLNYIYRRRVDAEERGLDYQVGSGTNLTEALTNATEEAGSVALGDGFDAVTNRVSIDSAPAQYLQLKVGAE